MTIPWILFALGAVFFVAGAFKRDYELVRLSVVSTICALISAIASAKAAFDSEPIFYVEDVVLLVAGFACMLAVKWKKGE